MEADSPHRDYTNNENHFPSPRRYRDSPLPLGLSLPISHVAGDGVRGKARIFFEFECFVVA